MNDWIKCSERLPTTRLKYKRLKVLRNGKDEDEARWTVFSCGTLGWLAKFDATEITHWQKLPLPPGPEAE